jgi:hypothetical protein
LLPLIKVPVAIGVWTLRKFRFATASTTKVYDRSDLTGIG